MPEIIERVSVLTAEAHPQQYAPALPRRPTSKAAAKALRNHEVERLEEAGVTQREIAAQVGLTQGRVSQLLKARQKLDEPVGTPRAARYELEYQVEYKAPRYGQVLHHGTGTTINISYSGILFTASQPLPLGMGIRMSIAWPSLQTDTVLELYVIGHVVRAQGKCIAVAIDWHEFRFLGTGRN